MGSNLIGWYEDQLSNLKACIIGLMDWSSYLLHSTFWTIDRSCHLSDVKNKKRSLVKALFNQNDFLASVYQTQNWFLIMWNMTFHSTVVYVKRHITTHLMPRSWYFHKREIRFDTSSVKQDKICKPNNKKKKRIYQLKT